MLRHVAPEPLLGRAMAINASGLISIQGLGFAAARAAVEQLIPTNLTIALVGDLGLFFVATLRPRR